MKKIIGILIDILIFPFFFWQRVLRPAPLKDVRKILILELWGIGDVVMMSAVLGPLREAHPGAEICLLCQEHGCEVLRGQKEISRFFVFKFPWTAFRGKYRFWAWDWTGIWRVLRDLRREKFDLLLDARGDPRNNFLSWLIGARRRVGIKASSGVGFLTDAVPLPPLARHRVEHWLELLKYLSIPAQGARISLVVTSREAQEAERFLRDHHLKDKKFLVGIHPGARIRVRAWPMERFGRIAQLLQEHYQAGIVVFVEPDGFGRDFPGLEQYVSVQLPLRPMMAVMGRLDLLVCNDGGAMHVASGLGVPTVAVFGPTDPAKFSPWGQGHEIVIQNNMPCRPCLDHCPQGRADCLARITVEDVWERVRACLGRANSK